MCGHEQAGNVANVWKRGNACRILMGRHETTRPLGRTSHRWEDIVKMDLKLIRWEGFDWLHLATDRDQWRDAVSAGINHCVPYSVWYLLTG